MGSIPFGLILAKIFLKKDIREDGAINEPIVVCKNPLNDEYTVFEGNTRLAIYNKNHERYPDIPFWKKIPAVIYKDIDDPMSGFARPERALLKINSQPVEVVP